MQVGKRMMEFDFNPRSPHGERREAAAALRRGAEFQSTLPARGATLVFVALCGTLSFQSTLPARGATEHGSQISLHISHFNPRSPHGERRHTARLNMLLSIISIHAPRTGSDGTAYITNGRAFSISIHAPRTGSDWADRGDNRRLWDFNPRSPHGERLSLSQVADKSRSSFQSTLPARGATSAVAAGIFTQEISIHAPRTGSDQQPQLLQLRPH